MSKSRYDQEQIETGLADISHIIVKKRGGESTTMQCRYEDGRLIAVGENKVIYADNGRISHIGDYEVTYENNYIVFVGSLCVSYKFNKYVTQIDEVISADGSGYASIRYNKPSVYDRYLADRLAAQRYFLHLGGHIERDDKTSLIREKLDRTYTAQLLAYLKILCDNYWEDNIYITQIQHVFHKHCGNETNYKTYPKPSYSNINEARYFFSSLPIERLRALVDDLRAHGAKFYSSYTISIDLLFRRRQPTTNELCGLLSKLYHYGKQSLNGMIAGSQYAETALPFFKENFPRYISSYGK